MKILSAKKFGVRLKATVQATGKLGFTKATSDALNLEQCPFVTFSQAEDDNRDLYLSISDIASGDAFRVLVSSGYYSLSTKALFGHKPKSRCIIISGNVLNLHDETI
jgi:hypothetical protein